MSSANIWEDTVETVKNKLRISEEKNPERVAYSDGFQVKDVYDKNNMRGLEKMGVFMGCWGQCCP